MGGVCGGYRHRVAPLRGSWLGATVLNSELCVCHSVDRPCCACSGVADGPIDAEVGVQGGFDVGGDTEAVHQDAHQGDGHDVTDVGEVGVADPATVRQVSSCVFCGCTCAKRVGDTAELRWASREA